ncbi:MAG: AmmeMemoRadiSam system radical SAM enzyme [Planctomycetes bacterium]|nr:AmmeMemoRadiSam system radical SAM enzyme [Planctomycetota bacterium]
MEFSRRDILRFAGSGFLAGLGSRFLFAEDALLPPADGRPNVHFRREARWYTKSKDGSVSCGLCPLHCTVAPGSRGACGVRENRGGVYYSLTWGSPCAVHVDPIEKKPLFHFRPGSRVYSFAAAGCNMSCKFCQNWDISQAAPDEMPSRALPPSALVPLVKSRKIDIIAFTYSEPTVSSEYVLDSASLARSEGIDTVTISNGFIEEAPLADLLRVLSAVKVDLKSFDDGFYRDICSARLKPVLDTLTRLAAAGTWFEIVYLVIPSLNDDMKMIASMSAWILKNLGASVPLHFTRFHPAYRLKNLPATPLSTLSRARQTALAEGLRFVYTGNVPGASGEDTFCPSCGKVLVERHEYHIMNVRLKNVSRNKKEASCEYCGAPVPGIW